MKYRAEGLGIENSPEESADIGICEDIEEIRETDKESLNKTGLVGDNRGVGVIEIILILVVLVALVVIFRDQITAVVESALSAVTEDTNSLISN